ncbi:ABC transporter substrate-binding protein [Peribacillus cavernae]|uniref:ABC transporter substrate-binding protein n=1 Tax=Peribacillus cavernae TaxID=1674310 RepID=A0A3S0VIC4_9BACI|nr:ABC transporter substrate-binding protein [Peribacillus cavernae]MDQ0219211.1 multiple sugar transport system substrate-binding protein [Peribacillus cavernae]RUQ28570.1 ABC transporter substrate-binding protein [Peribacillus cavernae]
MKKNVLKKAMLGVATGVMSLSLLAGCSGGEKQAANSDGKVEIEFWYGLGGKLGDNMKQKIDTFNKSQDEVIVKGIAQADYQETYQKLQAASASGQTPAVALLEHATANALANKQALAPLDSFFDKDKEANVEDFLPTLLDLGKANDKQYALPAYGTTQVLYYRKDMFEKAGIDPSVLNTWESLGEAAKKLKKEQGVFGWEPMWGNLNLVDASLSAGGEIISEDGKEVLIDSNEWVNTWEFFRKAIHEDQSMRIHHGGQGWEYWYKTIDDVMQDRAAGYTGSSGDQGDLDFSKLAAHPQPGWKNHKAAPQAEAQMLVIPAKAEKEQQEAAYKWMKYFTSSEVTADWSIKTGYIAVRESAKEVQAYKEFAEKNPQILVPLEQAKNGTPGFVDPTGGQILDALSKATDKVEIENIPAEKALKEAKEEAQKALDEAGK